MDLMKITIYSRASMYEGPDNFERKFLGGFSSAPSYDEALSSIFHHFTLVSSAQGETITEALAQGYDFGGGTKGPTSFASVLNDKGGRFNRNKVIWLSNASLATLQQHPDKFELDVRLSTDFPVMTPHED